MRRSLFLPLFVALSLPLSAGADSLGSLLDQSRGEVDAAIEQNAVDAAAERERNRIRELQRDKSRDFCYSLPPGSDAQKACTGEFISTIENDRARNIMLGNCYALSPSSELTNDLSYICHEGASGCSLLDDSDAAFQCRQCGGTRSWLATYSLGHIIHCY